MSITEPTTPPAPTTDQAEGPSTFLAFEQLKESSEGNQPIWSKTEVSLSIETPFTQKDMLAVEYFSSEISKIAEVPPVQISSGAGPFDIKLYFLPKNRWYEIDMDSPQIQQMSGYTKYAYRESVLESAIVVVDDDLDQLERNRTIVHELVHAYGLGHHECKGGLMYGGKDYDPSWKFSSYDVSLMSAWYSGGLSGFVDIPCPKVAWSPVVAPGSSTVVWCETSGKKCYDVSDTNGPDITNGPSWWRSGNNLSTYDPDLFVQVRVNGRILLCELSAQANEVSPCEEGADKTISSPNWWYDGSTVFDYNPTTHKTFILDSRRLLCEIPKGGRAPCQFTDGFSITKVDVYTDGTSVYNTIDGN